MGWWPIIMPDGSRRRGYETTAEYPVHPVGRPLSVPGEPESDGMEGWKCGPEDSPVEPGEHLLFRIQRGVTGSSGGLCGTEHRLYFSDTPGKIPGPDQRNRAGKCAAAEGPVSEKRQGGGKSPAWPVVPDRENLECTGHLDAVPPGPSSVGEGGTVQGSHPDFERGTP